MGLGLAYSVAGSFLFHLPDILSAGQPTKRSKGQKWDSWPWRRSIAEKGDYVYVSWQSPSTGLDQRRTGFGFSGQNHYGTSTRAKITHTCMTL